MQSFLFDLRYGARVLRKSPVFSLIVIRVLALGIGANSAVFSVVDAVLLRALPFRDPAGLALLLASGGLYGVLASLVSQHTQEIGIRMALGAQSTDVLGLIIFEGVRVVLLGVAIGFGAGIALTRYLASLFFGISPTNAVTYLEVGIVMVSIALLACLLPAWRALRVNPMVSLRYE